MPVEVHNVTVGRVRHFSQSGRAVGEDVRIRRRSKVQKRRAILVALANERDDLAVDERDEIGIEGGFFNRLRIGIVRIRRYAVGSDEGSGTESPSDFGNAAWKRGKVPLSGREIEKYRRAFGSNPEGAAFAQYDFWFHPVSNGVEFRIVTVRIPGDEPEFGNGIRVVVETAKLPVVLALFRFGSFFAKNGALRAYFGDRFFPIRLVGEGDYLSFEFDDAVDFVVRAHFYVFGIPFEAVRRYGKFVLERGDFGDDAVSAAFDRKHVGSAFRDGDFRDLRSTYRDVDFGNVAHEIVVDSESQDAEGRQEDEKGENSVAHSRWKKKIPHSVGIGILVRNYTEYAPVCK